MSVMESSTRSSSLSDVNRQIHDCIRQLNALVCLEIELNRQDALYRALVEQLRLLQEHRDAVKQQVQRQLKTFKAEHGEAPRIFYSALFKDLVKRYPLDDVAAWPVPPPYGEIAVPGRASRGKSRWYSLTAYGSYLISMHTRRRYYVPRLRLSSAIEDLEKLRNKILGTEEAAKQLQATLQYFKKGNMELTQACDTIRVELAQPQKVLESVSAYVEYASEARRYFCDEVALRARDALALSDTLCDQEVPPHQGSCVRPPGLFKSFVEHHGVELNQSSWTTISDSDGQSLRTLANDTADERSVSRLRHNEGETSLFTPLTEPSPCLLK